MVDHQTHAITRDFLQEYQHIARIPVPVAAFASGDLYRTEHLSDRRLDDASILDRNRLRVRGNLRIESLCTSYGGCVVTVECGDLVHSE